MPGLKHLAAVVPAIAALGVTIQSAHAIALVERVTAEVDPSTYDGPCPTTINLKGAVTVGVPGGHFLRYYYRWEAEGRPLTEEVFTMSKEKRDRFETPWPVPFAPGTSGVLPIRLHVYLATRNGKTEGDYFSPPVNVTVNCK